MNFGVVRFIAFHFWNLSFLFFEGYFCFLETCWSCCFINVGYSNIQNFKLMNWRRALNLELVACSWRFPVRDMLHLAITLFVHLLLRKNQKIIKLPSSRLESWSCRQQYKGQYWREMQRYKSHKKWEHILKIWARDWFCFGCFYLFLGSFCSLRLSSKLLQNHAEYLSNTLLILKELSLVM